MQLGLNIYLLNVLLSDLLHIYFRLDAVNSQEFNAWLFRVFVLNSEALFVHVRYLLVPVKDMNWLTVSKHVDLVLKWHREARLICCI